MQLLACIVLCTVPTLCRQLYSIFRRVYSQLSQPTYWMSEGLGPTWPLKVYPLRHVTAKPHRRSFISTIRVFVNKWGTAEAHSLLFPLHVFDVKAILFKLLLVPWMNWNWKTKTSSVAYVIHVRWLCAFTTLFLTQCKISGTFLYKIHNS